jgi:hypothetical protein
MNKFRKALEKMYRDMHLTKEEHDKVLEIEHQQYLKKIRRKQGEEIIKKGLNQS